MNSTKARSIAKALYHLVAKKDDIPTMQTFMVYSDESGKQSDADAKFVVLGSIVMAADDVSAFNAKWNGTLASVELQHTSMKEAMSFKGPFTGWQGRQSDRDGLLEVLAHTAYDGSFRLASSPMDVTDFKSLPAPQRKRLKNVIYAAFESMFKDISTYDSAEGPRNTFHLIYDMSEEYSVTMLRLFHHFRMLSQHYRDTIPSISFADDEDTPGLQAADMVAYCKREEFHNKERSKNGIIARLNEIMFRNEVTARYITYGPGVGLGSGVLDPKL